MKFNSYDIPYNCYSKLTNICPAGTWKKENPNSLSGIIPADLLSKTNSALIMCAASPQYTVYVFNLNRVDLPASAVDQQPYIVGFDHNTSKTTGGFIDHGNWLGRTTYPDEFFFQAISASGIQANYPLEEMPSSTSGLIDELKVSSQKDAFWASLSNLRKRT